jgi:hypothetical protein
MRYYDLEETKELNAEEWQLECLKKNPGYCSWGNYEDYMTDKNSQWGSPIELESVSELWELDELNELVNFYFEVKRANIPCEHCDQTGLNPETKQLRDDWYSFDKEEWININRNRRYNNKAWQYHLTEVEIKELVKAGRLNDLISVICYYDKETEKWYGWIDGEKQEIEEPEYPLPEKVNAWAIKGMGHDSINQWVAVKARARHLGVYGHCEHCDGVGYIYTEPKAKLSLQMWFIHPRKGSSRGVYLKNIEQNEVEKVVEYLKKARQRNYDRFEKL